MIHGRIYGEPEGWTMPSREFRILVAPDAMTITGTHLRDIDALGVFLRSLPGPPCRIRLFSVGSEEEVADSFAGLTVPVVRLSDPPSADSSERARAGLGDAARNVYLMELISRGLDARVDAIVPYPMPDSPLPAEVLRALDVAVLDWHEAKRACEVFVRGHEVPWAFEAYSWGLPWSHLYWIAESPTKLLELHARSREANVSHQGQEYIRSLAYNRHPSLAFTRDRLLFFLQQQRTARRFGVRRSDFVFEVNYYLNHYYLLLWGALDLLCLIVNEVYGVGFKERFVSNTNPGFLKALAGKPVHGVITDPKFTTWRDTLASVRHLAAHRGMTRASEMYFAPDKEPTDAELDAAIEQSEKWQANVSVFGRQGAEVYREVFRIEERVRLMERFPERVIPVEIDGLRKLVMPLVNIERDFEQCMLFANRVAYDLLQHLECEPAAPA
jgi:hypothetical protein